MAALTEALGPQHCRQSEKLAPRDPEPRSSKACRLARSNRALGGHDASILLSQGFLWQYRHDTRGYQDGGARVSLSRGLGEAHPNEQRKA